MCLIQMFQYLTLLEASNCICEIKLVFFGFVVSRSEVNLVQPIWWLWTAGNRKHILAHFSWGLKHKDNDSKRKESSIDPFVMGKREDSGKYFMCIFTSKTPLSLVYPKVQALCLCLHVFLYFTVCLACGVRKVENRFTDNGVLGKNRMFTHLH